MSPDQINELEIKYLHLKDKIEKYFTAKSEYFKNKDPKKLIILKNYEKEIREFINPKRESQQKLFNWLGQ